MKKTIQRIGAFVVSATMLLGLGLTVSAAAGDPAELSGGEVGGFTTPDTPNLSNKKINIAKELTAYNVDGLEVCAPTITYKYDIAPDTTSNTVTDATTDHASGETITVPTIPGITTNVTMTGTGDKEISWTNSDTLQTDTDGEANYKYLTVDFSNVVFTAPGVYRYKLTEELAGTDTYAMSGVTETTDVAGTTTDDGSHERYLDVYVRPSADYADGSTAAEWDIYGYVCSYNDEDITPDGDTTTTGSVKTNGFVSATETVTPQGGGDPVTHNISADSYYTFNVTITKDLQGDAYSKNHKFPVNVKFANDTITKNVHILADNIEKADDFSHDSTTFGTDGITGLAKIADDGTIRYVGIPNGTIVDVHESNDVTGVTYYVTMQVDSQTGTSKDVSFDSSYNAYADFDSTKAYNSTLAELTTTADADDNLSHTIAITNVFQTISPTGVIIRSAPYILLFGAGVVLLVLVRRGKKSSEEEEAEAEA